MKEQPKILLVTLGGTISARPDEYSRSTPARSGTDILASVPQAREVAEVEVADVNRVPSRAITPADMHALAYKVRAWAEEGYDGIVVTHGTDTMEETAYALALQLDVGIPVVLTGAMRTGQEPGSDGPANLMAALRVATTPQAAALGLASVVMHDEVHAARWVTKTHTSRVAAFSSPTSGPVGYLAEGRVMLSARPTERDYLGFPDTLDKRVEIVWVASGADGLLVEAAAAAADGLVVAGTGGGHVPPEMAEALQNAVTGGLPVVLASRCAGGPVLEGTYGGVGSETHLLGIGLHSAGSLSPLKARLRLLVALALGMDPAEAFSA